MEQPNDTQKLSLSLKTWIALIGITITILGTGTAALSAVFAPKSIEIDVATVRKQAEFSDWKLEALRVEQQNLAAQQRRTDTNVVRIMERMRIEPVPEPTLAPVPAAPAAPTSKPK